MKTIESTCGCGVTTTNRLCRLAPKTSPSNKLRTNPTGSLGFTNSYARQAEVWNLCITARMQQSSSWRIPAAVLGGSGGSGGMLGTELASTRVRGVKGGRSSSPIAWQTSSSSTKRTPAVTGRKQAAMPKANRSGALFRHHLFRTMKRLVRLAR